jgi:hypothetical protein
MTIMMTVMDGAEAETVLTSSVINNITGIAISSRLGTAPSGVQLFTGSVIKNVSGLDICGKICGYTTVNRTDISR